MIFMNRTLFVYTGEGTDPIKAHKFAQTVLMMGAQFRGEIPNADR